MSEWVEKYITLLKQGIKQVANELKLNNIPLFLYKYRALNTYTLNCLEKGTVWMPPANYLNDPFECSLSLNDIELSRKFFTKENFAQEFYTQYNCQISKKEIEEIINSSDPESSFHAICNEKNIDRDFSSAKQIRKNILDEYISKTKREVRLCSFSEINDSILMWSHYSDGHKGICIQYDFGASKEICTYLEPVHYTNQIFDMTPYMGTGQVPLKIAAITKALDWQYEKEWRLTFPAEDENPDNGHYNVPNPKAIFLGARFSDNDEKDKQALMSIAKKRNTPIYQMNIHNAEFKIIQNAK